MKGLVKGQTGMATQLTINQAAGAAALAANGQLVMCWINVQRGDDVIQRHCAVRSAGSADFSTLWLSCMVGSEQRLAEVPVDRIWVAQYTADKCQIAYDRCQIAYDRMQETAEAASETESDPEMWVRSGARRNPVTGRYTGHHCERAARTSRL